MKRALKTGAVVFMTLAMLVSFVACNEILSNQATYHQATSQTLLVNNLYCSGQQ